MPGTAIERVIAGPAIEPVIAGATQEHIGVHVPRKGVAIVGSGHILDTSQCVVPRGPRCLSSSQAHRHCSTGPGIRGGVGSRAAVQGVVAQATVQGVITRAGGQGVGTIVTGQIVGVI